MFLDVLIGYLVAVFIGEPVAKAAPDAPKFSFLAVLLMLIVYGFIGFVCVVAATLYR